MIIKRAVIARVRVGDKRVTAGKGKSESRGSCSVSQSEGVTGLTREEGT